MPLPSDSRVETRRVNLPRGSVDDLQRGIGCVELLAHLSPPGVSDKKPCAFVDVAFHPLKPWVAAIEQKGCGIVWDYETGDVVTEFDMGESQVLDDDEAHETSEDAADGAESAGVYNPTAAAKGLLSRATASPSARSVQGAAAAAKGLLSPTGPSLIKPRRRPSLQMLFYDHEAIACTTQLPASRTCFDEWLIIVSRSHIVICDLDQNGAVHHLDPEDLHRGLPSSVAILPSGLLAIGCQDGKIRIWSPWQSKTVGTLDSGSQRDVQQLILLTTPPILMKRSGSGSLPGAETRLSTQLHHLACATLDGHVVTWRVSLNASTASCDCVKTSEVELRDVFRQFDTVNGVHELKFHPQQDVMTAACRDGTIFFFDVAPLLDSNKPATLTGLLPNSKLQSIVVLPGAQKGCFTALSMSALNSTLVVSEIGVKGRYSGKDNVPTIFTEFTSCNTQESRDLRVFVIPMPAKRLKMASLTSSVRNPGELCCLTSYGLLVLKTSFLAAPTPIFIPRGSSITPAIGFPSSMAVRVRVLGEDPQDKPQVHVVQNGAEAQTPATIERSRVPLLQYSPWQNGFLAAILPIGGHLEILQLGLKPVPPNAVDLETIFVAHAFGFAWHPSQPLFAVLAPNKELSGKITRSNTASAIVPNKRSRFFFGGSRASAANATDEPDARQQRAAARSLTLTIYKISGDDAEIEFVETSFASGEDNVLHVFSGPLLGIVKYVADVNVPDPAPLVAGGAIVKRARDSPASLSRVQRAQSFMLGLSAMSSPKMTDLRLTMMSPSQSPSASPTAASFESIDSASDLTKTFLEFYEWSPVTGVAEGETGLRKLAGGFAVDCPLSLEWDTATHSLCALVYPTSIKIYRFSSSTNDQSKQFEGDSTSTMTLLHEIPTPSPALSLHWVHHTLFFTTEDEVKCSLISRTRCFTLALASRWVLNEASCATQVSDDDLNQFPRPQIFPAGATTILGVLDQKLVLGGPLQAVHILDLSNRVLQCAVLVTAESVERAAELAQPLCPDATEWLGAVFEAFDHASEALRFLPGLSLSLKVNMCIKHALLEPLAKLLGDLIDHERDSPNLTGPSLFQRACIALYRGKMEAPLTQLGTALLSRKRHNDAIFVASLLRNDEQLVQAYASAEEWGAAFHAAKAKTSATMPTPAAILNKWNASVAKPTAAWRTVLERQGIRPPTMVKLQAAGLPQKEPLVVVDEPTTSSSNGDHFVERVVFHPSRKSIVCVKGDTLEELDVSTGALLCHITFDLLASSNVDFILPAGPHFVVGLLQSRLLIVWDLDESVLLATSDADKVHGTRRVTALATSLCADRWLFFNAEGSNNVRVTRVDSPRPAREILRKSALRGGSVVSLAYSTEHHLLSSGCNDGTIQVWSISSNEVDAGVPKKGQETTGFATPLFAVQLAQSPVVEICIGMCTGCGTNGSSSNMFLAAAYQNRRADVIAMNGQAHTCVASTMLAPPQTSDFSRLGGALTLAIHAQLPVLLMHWRSHRSDLGVDVIAAWELVNTGGSSVTSPRGGAGGNSSGGGAMTNWWPVANSSTLNMSMGRRQVLATDIVLWQNSLAVYASTIDRRSIFLIDIQPNQTSTNATEMEPKTVLALSTMTQLTLAQYHDYPTGIPTSQLQIAVKTSAKGTPVLKLQRFSQVSGGLTGSSDQLLDWKSERGVPLLPFQVLASRHQSAVCIKLCEKGEDAATNGKRPSSFSCVVLDLDVMVDTAMTDVIVNPDDDDGVIAASSLPAIELKYGSLQHEARDVCFSMNSSVDSGDASKSQSYLLLVLSKTGDAITFQTTRDPSNERVKLNQPVERVFATPHLLPATSPYQSAVVCKLLYLLEPGLQSERLVLSGDDLSVPVESSPSWMCEANERIVDVQWNSSTCPQIGPHDSQQRLLLAVTTTQRIVVLSPELRQLRAYDFKNDLMGVPESLLWVSQTLLYSTTGNQVRFVTPVADHLQNDTSRLLCSIADLDTRSGFTQSSIQLVSMCGDRLCYAVSNAVTLSSRLTLHSVALCEPLLLGFAVPNATLRRLFEREMVAFTLMNDDSDRPVCSISDAVLETAYHTFGWKNKVLKVLKALINSHEKSSSAVAADGGAVVAPSSNYSRTSLLSRTIMGSIFLDAHKWEDFLRVFLAHDPALEEYVIAIDSDGAAKLPSRMGPTARRFRQLAAVFESIGQPDWAMRCLDLSGDDEALLTMFRKFNTASASSEVIDTLQKTWTKLNPPLSAITKAAMTQQDSQHDPFSILCCETLTQPVRRGRLLNSVAPLDRLKLSVEKLPSQDDSNDPTRAGTLPWKRLAPEDASEWLGVSTKARIATTEPRALNYSLFATEASAISGSLLNVDAISTPAAFSPTPGASAEAASAKMTIGPFQDEEDAVVAYWRFEEGATASSEPSQDGIECLDTSKRENTLRLFGAVNLVESSAPVDRGEPGRIPEEFALRFPSSTSSLPSSGWGAQCPIRPGSTLDIATTFDEDPYRREFTFEVWVRNYKMCDQIQKIVGNGDEIPATLSSGARQVLVSRKRVESLDDGVKGEDVAGLASWELVIDEDDHLVLTFGNQQVRSTQKMEHSGNLGWRHVAFTMDVSSPQRVGLKLYLDARCVGESQTTPSNQTVSKPSKLLLGWRMQDYEMTEVRLWATARSADQLSDMRENYLGLAEAKRRMKIAIHQRNCTCEKCVSRRAQSAGAGAGGAPRLGLSLTTPLAPPSRQRRVVPQAKPT
ncbi:hypothetical protein PC121_g2009 [Phytophthora cactorum]|nr:hypothetical protein PC121_g2009 [Phytophthora cactorum]